MAASSADLSTSFDILLLELSAVLALSIFYVGVWVIWEFELRQSASDSRLERMLDTVENVNESV